MENRGLPIQIVVEGVGDVVDRQHFYGDALSDLKTQCGDSVDIVFCDLRDNWKDKPEVRDKREATIAKVEASGCRFIDKSNAVMRQEYAKLRPDYVIIATSDNYHESVASSWLDRGLGNFGQIFIEKPLARTICQGAKLLRHVSKLYGSVQIVNDILSFDHYYARFRPTDEQLKHIKTRLGRIRWFGFYFLEDGSGGEHNGPIENEGRWEAVEEGLILDMMPHVVAIANRFGRIETMWVKSVKAGQYVGVGYDMSRRTRIKKETFAEVQFSYVTSFLDPAELGSEWRGYHSNHEIPGVAYVGKGISRVEGLGLSSPVKRAEIEGETGERLEIDFSNGQMRLLREGSDFSDALRARPYCEFVRALIPELRQEDDDPTRFGQLVQRGFRILEVLDAMRCPINVVVAKKPDGLPTYSLGRLGESAPSLEEVLRGVGDSVNDEEPT